eukprot:4621681-Prymnesium_polylepis.2
MSDTNREEMSDFGHVGPDLVSAALAVDCKLPVPIKVTRKTPSIDSPDELIAQHMLVATRPQCYCSTGFGVHGTRTGYSYELQGDVVHVWVDHVSLNLSFCSRHVLVKDLQPADGPTVRGKICSDLRAGSAEVKNLRFDAAYARTVLMIISRLKEQDQTWYRWYSKTRGISKEKAKQFPMEYRTRKLLVIEAEASYVVQNKQDSASEIRKNTNRPPPKHVR